MVDCAIIGDNTALSIHADMPWCYVRAAGEITSTLYTLWYSQTIEADKILITIGSFDQATARTKTNLIEIRKRLISKNVTWLVVANNTDVANIIREIARSYGDNTIELQNYIADQKNTRLEQRTVKNIVSEWTK